MRALASTGATRSATLPDLPTIVGSGRAGLRGGDLARHHGAGRNARAIVEEAQRGNHEGDECAGDEVEAWAKQSVEPSVMSAADYDKFLRGEVEKWAEVVKVSGAKIE